jgi:hypothetical protein
MKLEFSTSLNATTAQVWALVQRPTTLEFIAAPLVRFTPLKPNVWPERWQDGQHLARLKLFGMVAMGTQSINISFPAAQTMRDNGSGQLVRVWDHWITVSALPDGKTKYTDAVEVRAGWLTPFIWLFASAFYWHRQRRWHQLLEVQHRRGAQA